MQENRDNRQDQQSSPYNEQVASGQAGGIIDEYIVEEKDTLPDIARRYGISIEEIMAANPGIDEPADMVKPGLRLMIPKKREG